VHIVYTVSESVSAGSYDVKLHDVELTNLNSGETGYQEEVSTSVTVEDATGSERVEAPEILYYNGRLTVRTAKAERIDVYSVTGQLFYQSQKAAGEATFDLSSLPRGVLIIRGSSGWVKKVYK
jgi:hypothetical protein